MTVNESQKNCETAESAKLFALLLSNNMKCQFKESQVWMQGYLKDFRSNKILKDLEWFFFKFNGHFIKL